MFLHADPRRIKVLWVFQARFITKESRLEISRDEAFAKLNPGRTTSCRGRVKAALSWLDRLSPSELEAVAHNTFASILRDCSNLKALPEGKRVHAHIAANGYDRYTFVGNMLVQMYGSCGSLEDANAVFDNIRGRNVFSWNILLAAYAQNGHLRVAKDWFDKMPHWNVISYNVMIAAYAQNGHLMEARGFFDEMPEQNVVSWNAVIAAYAQEGHLQQALEIFRRMSLQGESPNYVTFVTILDACASLEAATEGRIMHTLIVDANLESDNKVANALISMYGKCGIMLNARYVFDKMPELNVVSWSALIATYASNGYNKEALELFLKMDLEGMKPNAVTFISILDTCATLAALAEGKEIHASIEDSGFRLELNLGNVLINMYGKCGSVENARRTFDTMPERDVISWSAMVAAYSQNGHNLEALELFRNMELAGIKPNDVTFMSVLSACSHAGLLEDGCHYFAATVEDYGVVRKLDHYRIMVDLLGRAGKLEEAEVFVDDMPFQHDPIAWSTLLSACRIHNDAIRGMRAAERVGALGLDCSSSYILLSNIYANTSRISEDRQTGH